MICVPLAARCVIYGSLSISVSYLVICMYLIYSYICMYVCMYVRRRISRTVHRYGRSGPPLCVSVRQTWTVPLRQGRAQDRPWTWTNQLQCRAPPGSYDCSCCEPGCCTLSATSTGKGRTHRPYLMGLMSFPIRVTRCDDSN